MEIKKEDGMREKIMKLLSELQYQFYVNRVGSRYQQEEDSKNDNRKREAIDQIIALFPIWSGHSRMNLEPELTGEGESLREIDKNLAQLNLFGTMITEGKMKKIRNYTIVCPSCRGAGFIDSPRGFRVSASATITCPACQGSKTVLVAEVEEVS